MFRKKKELEELIQNLSDKLVKLEKENKDLKKKYAKNITTDENIEAYKKKLEEDALHKAEIYKKQLDELVAQKTNYAFLQQLVNTSKDEGTVIEVRKRDGDVIVIRHENENDYRKAAEDIFDLSKI